MGAWGVLQRVDLCGLWWIEVDDGLDRLVLLIELFFVFELVYLRTACIPRVCFRESALFPFALTRSSRLGVFCGVLPGQIKGLVVRAL